MENEKLKSLSERLRYLVNRRNSYREYTDQTIKSENLKFNLSLVLSQIILNLKFIERSKQAFVKIIEEYNQANKASLTFEDFEEINWIRMVVDEAVMPELVRHFIWEVGYRESEGKSIEIPPDKENLIRCLQIYYQRCFQNSKLTIGKAELETILNHHGVNELTIDFLLKKSVVGYDETNGLFYWKDQEYSRHLRNEIGATVWLLVGGEEATLEDFRRYFKLILRADLYIDDLGRFLTYKNTSKINELATSLLNSEPDLLRSDNEFNKIWLDAASYQDIDIKSEIPVVQFNYASAFDFIESVTYHKWRFRDSFDYQRTRSFCHPLIRIIVDSDTDKYNTVLRILKDTSRPFLLWTLFTDIKREFPFVIPYLLLDRELSPIAFKLIDKIEIDSVFLSEEPNSDRAFEAAYEIQNQLWLEMFDFSLEKIATTSSFEKQNGELLAKILIDLSEKVFSINLNNRNGIISHNALRKRYNDALKKFSNKRIENVNAYPSQPIKSRIAHSFLPEIINCIKNKFQGEYPNHTEFLNLKSGLIDLSIEILRLSNLRISEGEFTKQDIERYERAAKELVSLLYNYKSEFYSLKEIDVQVYNKPAREKRKAKRGLREFGFEIIDWGYLYLCFEKSGVLQDLTDRFTAALNFNNSGSKYDEQNREQYEKVKMFLKSIMLGYISINQKRNILEIDGLPVKITLENLEKWIRHFSLIYSTENIPQNQIDVFDEMFGVVYDLYYQQLTSLLYRSINYFNEKGQAKFVQDFFSSSSDTGRMLTAINILDSTKLRDIISKRLSEVKIEDFIKNSYTTTELQYALAEAVNSDNHWELAKPLIDRIQNHFKRVKHSDEQTDYFLFEVNLLLAFKERNFEKLSKMTMPKNEFRHQSGNRKAKNIKDFFIALYKIYNDKHYDEAILILKSLLSDETKNVRYAFHLYRAETLKAIETP